MHFVLCLLISGVLVGAGSCATTSVRVVNLVENWAIKNVNRSIEIKSLKIPTSVHTALRMNGLIPEPYYRYNDLITRWVALDEGWVFENSFEVADNETIMNNRVDLIFHGVDTVARIYLNGYFIQFTDNQFVKYTVENVNRFLKKGSNKIEIKFRSAVNYARTLASVYPYRVPPECWPQTRRGECHANFVRKEQCSFGWDWGPAFATMALNDLVSVHYISHFSADVSPSIHPESINDQKLENWIIDNKLQITQFTGSWKDSGDFEVSIPELNFKFSTNLNLNSEVSEIYVPVLVSKAAYNVELWYPNGYGAQKLYEVSFRIKIDDAVFENKKMLGFRSVQLIEEPMPGENNGLSFYFKINNIPIFLKGSNWIPADSFKENITDEYLEWLLFSAKDAHMNVLRIWGGGIYEDERFFNLADKYGIMIWEDFMFACATYPTNPDFLASVEKEVKTQVLRLRQHPSVVVWAGNNENEALVGTNWFGTNSDRELYETDYRKLYIDLIKTVLLELDPEISRPYLSSSPTNGAHTGVENSNWVSPNPYNLKYGDLHFYDYYINSWEPSEWPVPRLASEYGFQSFPSFSTLAKVYDEKDLDFYSDLNEHRQHRDSEEGNKEIEWQIMFHTKTAKLANAAENFKNFIYLSQVYQAMSLKVYNELLRRSRDTYDVKTGIGKTMGAMYWQYNDIWQAPTWASLEYGGKWKMSHYYGKRSFAPVLVSPSIDLEKKKLFVHVVSDLVDETFSDVLNVKVFGYESFNAKYSISQPFLVRSLDTSLVFEWDLDRLKQDAKCGYNETYSCIVTFELAEHKEFNDGENSIFLNNFFHHVENLKRPTLEVTSVFKDTNEFTVKIKTSDVALFVWLDLATTEIRGRFEDNGFHMTQPEREVKLRVQNHAAVTVDFIKANLQVRSLVLYKKGESGTVIDGNTGLVKLASSLLIAISMLMALLIAF